MFGFVTERRYRVILGKVLQIIGFCTVAYLLAYSFHSCNVERIEKMMHERTNKLKAGWNHE